MVIAKNMIVLLFSMALLACELDRNSPENVDQSIKTPLPSQTKPDFPSRLLWGDTHVHSSLSMDAHIYGNTNLGPEMAYKFAKGEVVKLADGSQAQLKRPLDFLVVADHAEYLGVRRGLADNDQSLLATETGAHWHHHMTSPDGDPSVPLLEFAASLRQGENLLEDVEYSNSVWQEMIALGEAANEPGVFTSLFGYEWSAMPGSNNLHRVVVFRDGPNEVSLHQPFSALDGSEPEALWAALKAYEQKSGGRVLTIPHNPNISGGKMFSAQMSNGQAMDETYARTRAYFEKILEVTQVKGDSETHPFLSPDDEFADFERWDKSNIGMVEPHRDEWFKGEYARAALKRGLQLENELGVNPFQFGMIGSSDQHNSMTNVTEESFPGKFTMPGQGPDRWDFTVGPETLLPQVYYEWELAAAGYAGVWARNNTRADIFDALDRRETFATTGPRMTVRFFASTNFPADLLNAEDWVSKAYQTGVPMGSVIELNRGQIPKFVLYAAKDPEGANLDRIQVVKGWVDQQGASHEKVYDVVLSDPARRHGEHIAPVGNTVDLAYATYTNSIGATRLFDIWIDPDFNENENAFYYLRVLEIPTPRWTHYATANQPSEKIPAHVSKSLQERAYTSPIWVNFKQKKPVPE